MSALGALAATAALALAGMQQPSGCELDVRTMPGSRSHYQILSEGDSRLDAAGGVEAVCGSRSVKADSATYYDERGELYLFRNVFYQDENHTLVADSAVYYASEDRVRADGHVVLNDVAGGSTLSGPVLFYYPKTERRAMERVFAPSRPHLTLSTDAEAQTGAPRFEVDADRIHIHGDSIMAAAGRVITEHGNLYASADSMDLDLGQGKIWLLGEPSLESDDMVLEGDTILILLEDNDVREIQAWPNGSVIGRELSLTAPSLRTFVAGEEINRVVAAAGDPERTGAADTQPREPWARSESENYTLVADSIDIFRPSGRLERLVAVGRARAATNQPVIVGDDQFEHDWLEGDTITGYFAPADSLTGNSLVDGSQSVSESEPKVELERLVAAGSARAFYYILEEDGQRTATGRPAVNYVLGRVVTLWLRGGEVQEARVIGPSTGLYLEPLPPATDGDSLVAAPADSVTSAADSIPRPPRPRPDSVRTSGAKGEHR